MIDQAKENTGKELIEPTFGIIKEQMGIRRFLLRGLNNVRTEGCFVATAFNLRILYRVWKVWGSKKRIKLFNMVKKLGNNSLQKPIYSVTFFKYNYLGLSIFTVR
jgi:hypothetical protein